MDDKNRSFLGKGWAFPPVFDPVSNSVEMVEEEKDIYQSLWIIISTIPGERVMQPLFGCNLHKMIFKRINTQTLTEIKDLIYMAVINDEPRVDLHEVLTRIHPEEPSRVDITLSYTIRLTNVRTNMVYPFYFREGTDIKEDHSI
jgi:phage baseplate assembly protein W